MFDFPKGEECGEESNDDRGKIEGSLQHVVLGMKDHDPYTRILQTLRVSKPKSSRAVEGSWPDYERFKCPVEISYYERDVSTGVLSGSRIRAPAMSCNDQDLKDKLEAARSDFCKLLD